MSTRIEGLIAAPLTGFKADGSINPDVVEAQVQSLHRNGVVGAFVNGTTGEGMSLTTAERMQVAEQWTRVAPKDFKVIVHVGHTSVEVCNRLAEHAQRIGAWGIGALSPFFYKPASVDDLVSFCEEMASHAPQLPFYYYHMPSMTGVDFPMAAFLRAARDRIATLAGIKYTWENLADFQECFTVDQGRFDMLFGRDELLICALALGARGAVGSTYNFFAPLYTDLMKAFNAGEIEKARTLQAKANEIIRVLCRTEGSFFAAGKAVMALLGIDLGPVRPPLRDITPQERDRLKKRLEQIGFFECCSR